MTTMNDALKALLDHHDMSIISPDAFIASVVGGESDSHHEAHEAREAREAREYVSDAIATGAEMEYVRKSISMGTIHQLVIHSTIIKITDIARYLNSTDLTCSICGDVATGVAIHLEPCSMGMSFVTNKNVPFTIDHIVPKKDKGLNLPINYAPACKSCNSLKGHQHQHDYTDVVNMGRLWFMVRKLAGTGPDYIRLRARGDGMYMHYVDGLISIVEAKRLIKLIIGIFPHLTTEELLEGGLGRIPTSRAYKAVQNAR